MSPCQCLCWCGSVHPNLAQTKMSGCEAINRYHMLEGRLEYPWMVNSVQQSCKKPWELAISCFFVNHCSIEMERYMKSVLQETLLDISLVMIQSFFVYLHILNVQRNYEIESCNQIAHLTCHMCEFLSTIMSHLYIVCICLILCQVAFHGNLSMLWLCLLHVFDSSYDAPDNAVAPRWIFRCVNDSAWCGTPWDLSYIA